MSISFYREQPSGLLCSALKRNFRVIPLDGT